MANIGVIGLGAMGFPIAKNLLDAGNIVHVVTHQNKAPIDYLQKLGAQVWNDYPSLASHSDHLILVLPNAPEVEEVLFGNTKTLEALPKGAMIIDMSTIALQPSRNFAAQLAQLGFHYIDAPISGGPKGAEEATLAIMIGAEPEDFKRVKELVQVLGKNIIHCGKQGLGLAAKFANNLIVASQLAAISEAMMLAVKAGIEPEILFSVLKGASASSRILEAKEKMICEGGTYKPGFALSLMYKDLEAITSTAKLLETPMPVGIMVQEMYKMSKAQFGSEDSAAINRYYQQLSGLQIGEKSDT